MKTSKKNNPIAANGGRIFGLSTSKETINARFVSESTQYVTVYDNNAQRNRKFHKTSLTGFRSGATVI